jgi:hypothetical protein
LAINLERAEAALKKAERSLANIQAVTALAEKAEHWDDFLVRWKRSINLATAAGRGTRNAAVDAMWQAIRTDDVLLYANEARNADEHSVAGHATISPQSTTIGDPGQSGRLTLRTGANGEIVYLKTDLTVRRHEARIDLNPVEYKGQKVSAPTQDYVAIGKHAVAFARASFAAIKRPPQ